MDGWTDERTENLPILQDFVPYRGHCPATAQLQPENRKKWGKGTADHMMPLGDWLTFSPTFFVTFIQTLFLSKSPFWAAAPIGDVVL